MSSGIANSNGKGFAILEFNTTIADPTLRIRLLSNDAAARWDHTIRLSELKVK